MTHTTHFLFTCLICCLFLPCTSIAQTSGPDNGSLLIVGGAMKNKVIIDKFIELAGGIDAPMVIIPTAAGLKSYSENIGLAGKLREMGATNVTILHTNDPKEANTDSFVQPLLNAKGVWFGGGRQWRLVDSYKNTLTEQLIWKVLERGGVVGGSSAGATIQGSFLARGDTKNNQVMMGDHQEGFGFLKNSAIDQHVLARNRQFDLFQIIDAHPELLGIGIDEDTAILVKKDSFEVLGSHYVLIYDQSFWSREGWKLKQLPDPNRQFFMLMPGDRYDMKNRKVLD